MAYFDTKSHLFCRMNVIHSSWYMGFWWEGSLVMLHTYNCKHLSSSPVVNHIFSCNGSSEKQTSSISLVAGFLLLIHHHFFCLFVHLPSLYRLREFIKHVVEVPKSLFINFLCLFVLKNNLVVLGFFELIMHLSWEIIILEICVWSKQNWTWYDLWYIFYECYALNVIQTLNFALWR